MNQPPLLPSPHLPPRRRSCSPRACLVVWFTLALATGANPPPAPPALAATLDQIRAKHRLPSIACVVFRGDRTLEEAAVGVRKLGSPEQVTLDDHYHIGSLTKSMTATLAAMLVRDGKLTWETTIQQVLGKDGTSIHTGYRTVTLLQLLQHRGGAPHEPPAPLWSDLWKRGDRPPTDNRSWFTGEILHAKPAQEPGTFAYSNTGYMIAGRMIEETAGHPWEDLVRQHLFRPLHMTSAGFGPAAAPDQVDQPWGHADAKPVPPGPAADNPPALGPAGTVHCSPRDLARYAAFHLREGKGRLELLDSAALRFLHTPPAGDKTNPYAAGWSRLPRDWAAGDALTHNGCNTMNYAVVWLAPARDFGVVILSNEGRGTVAKALDEVAAAMVAKHCPPL